LPVVIQSKFHLYKLLGLAFGLFLGKVKVEISKACPSFQALPSEPLSSLRGPFHQWVDNLLRHPVL
jgi:hypothetical protein